MNVFIRLASEENKKLSPAKAQLADLDNIVNIYNQAISKKTSTADLVPQTCKDKELWFDKHYNVDNREIFVLKDGDSVVAWASLSNLYDRKAYHITCEVSIYIDESYQGYGIGKQFLSWVLEQASDYSVKNMVAKIFSHNEASLALFKKLGFKQWGILPQVCDMESFIADVVILGKVITE